MSSSLKNRLFLRFFSNQYNRNIHSVSALHCELFIMKMVMYVQGVCESYPNTRPSYIRHLKLQVYAMPTDIFTLVSNKLVQCVTQSQVEVPLSLTNVPMHSFPTSAEVTFTWTCTGEHHCRCDPCPSLLHTLSNPS